jgi:sugar lactone lactonase YvrE
MKKKYFITITIYLFCINLNCQTTEVVNELKIPFGIAFKGSELYIAQYDTGKISKIDISISNPTLTDVITGLDHPFGIAFNGNDLYIAEVVGKKISKVNVTATTPTLTDVITGLDFVYGLAFKGDELYFSERSLNKISKINITTAQTIVTTVSNGLNGPIRLIFNENDLYFSEYDGNRISKIDTNLTPPISSDLIVELDVPGDMAFKGNELYISSETGNIYKIDITEASINAYTVLSGLKNPSGLRFNGNDLYISDIGLNNISKYSLPTLSTNELFIKEKVILFPNPAVNFIQVPGITKFEKYNIYDYLGKTVINGVIFNDEKIDIQTLTNGIYFLKLNNGNKIKFIKSEIN